MRFWDLIFSVVYRAAETFVFTVRKGESSLRSIAWAAFPVNPERNIPTTCVTPSIPRRSRNAGTAWRSCKPQVLPGHGTPRRASTLPAAAGKGNGGGKSTSASPSQECSVCDYTDRTNRPDQRTFRCQVCGFEAHADHNASVNISRRFGDRHLRACRDRTAIKAVLMQRHEAWKQQQGMRSTSPMKRRNRGKPSALASSI